MLKKIDFETYEPIVLEAIEELFICCISRETKENNFLLFLENAHYEESLLKFNVDPYIIGDGNMGFKDNDRIAFLTAFTEIDFEKFYDKAENSQEEFEIRQKSTALSMMVYIQFWESKYFLRKLRLLALLASGNEYDWYLNVRPTNTFNFIKNDVRSVFQKEGLKIYGILKDAYKSQIRNAFAHSDFYISDKKIYLDNYDTNDNWSIEYLNFEDFDKIITITLLIHHALVILTDQYINKLGTENPDRKIFVPENGGTYRFLHFREVSEGYSRWLWPNQLKP